MNRTTITTLTLALAGGGMWAFCGNHLAENHGFDYQPNPMGIKRSPYGQVLAMAIQSPIDADWHGGLEIHDHPHGDHDHSHGCDHDHDHDVAEHAPSDHDDAEGCSGCSDCGSSALAANTEQIGVLEQLENAVSQRTNPNPPTAGHQLYLRQEIEKKLRFAYDLDPSHYANYNSYHLFITQRELGTHGLPENEVTKMVETLADYTIRYCFTEQHDPRPALTAAAAAYNVLERMLTAKVREAEQDEIERMREQLEVMDFCIRRHFDLLEDFIGNGSFAKLSDQRQEEILTRSRFTVKLRDAAQQAINRLETPEPTTADAS